MEREIPLLEKYDETKFQKSMQRISEELEKLIKVNEELDEIEKLKNSIFGKHI